MSGSAVGLVSVPGPLGGFAEAFASTLGERGYARSGVVTQLRLLAALSCWLEREGVDGVSLTPEALSRFVGEHRIPGGVRLGRGRWRA